MPWERPSIKQNKTKQKNKQTKKNKVSVDLNFGEDTLVFELFSFFKLNIVAFIETLLNFAIFNGLPISHYTIKLIGYEKFYVIQFK